jgi:hypothetical protein
MTTSFFRVPVGVHKICKHFAAKKDIRKYLYNIQIVVNNGTLYMQSTNGHVAIRCVVEHKADLPDGDYGIYPPHTVGDTLLKVVDGKLIDPTTDKIIEKVDDYYPDFTKIMPYSESPNMIEVTTPYQINVVYHADAVKLLHSIMKNNSLGRPLAFKSKNGDPHKAYEHRCDDVTILIMPFSRAN